MAPKKSISESDIALTAFNMVRSIGMRSLTARKISLEMGCSTMPIYSTIGSMSHLCGRVMQIGYMWLEELRRSMHSGCPLIDFEVAMWLLSSRESYLWQLMFLNDNEEMREIQFPEWRRIAEEVDLAFMDQSSTMHAVDTPKETRIGHLHDIAHCIFGVCASINLGTFFYYTVTPEDMRSHIVDYFLRLNHNMIPWYTSQDIIPGDLERLCADSLARVISRLAAQPQ